MKSRDFQQCRDLSVSSSFPAAMACVRASEECFRGDHGFVNYRQLGDYWVMAGEPFPLAGTSVQSLFNEFVCWANRKGKTVCGYYISEPWTLPTHRTHQLGVTNAVYLPNFDLSKCGKGDLRRALRKGSQSQFLVTELLDRERGELYQHFEEIYLQWLNQIRGPRVAFLLSGLGIDWMAHRIFYLCHEGVPCAYLTLLPYGRGYYLDQMVRKPHGPKFAMDNLLLQVIETLKCEGLQYFSFGLTPFVGISPGTWLERLFSWHGDLELFYRSRGLIRFKRKFAEIEEPAYLIMDSSKGQLGQMWAILCATYSH
jgi:lysylphosphatidylglycerol synthetase-like protein (DUF2156 family)